MMELEQIHTKLAAGPREGVEVIEIEMRRKGDRNAGWGIENVSNHIA